MTMLLLLGIAALFALVPAALITVAFSARIAALRREVDELKRNALLPSDVNRHYEMPGAPVEFGEPPIPHWNPIDNDPQLLDLIRRGQKIPAIKLYRDRTGVGLKEAKDAVEALEIRTR